MQISALPGTNLSNYSTSSPAKAASKPEDFLTDGDVKMLEQVTGTTSLDAAEANPNGKILAVSMGNKRESGVVQGDFRQCYIPAQLSESDARMIESMTGTNNIIDAVVTGGSSLYNLVLNIGLDRKYGFVSGDLSPDYFNNLISFDKEQTAQHGGAGVVISVDTLNQALAYLQANVQKTYTAQETASSYSTSG